MDGFLKQVYAAFSCSNSKPIFTAFFAPTLKGRKSVKIKLTLCFECFEECKFEQPNKKFTAERSDT
jgi:hypothetical protein